MTVKELAQIYSISENVIRGLADVGIIKIERFVERNFIMRFGKEKHWYHGTKNHYRENIDPDYVDVLENIINEMYSNDEYESDYDVSKSSFRPTEHLSKKELVNEYLRTGSELTLILLKGIES